MTKKDDKSEEDKAPANPLDAADILPRDKRKAKKQKEKKTDEVETAIARSKIKGERDKKKKKRLLQIVGAVVLGLCGWSIYYLFAPYEGTMAFGVCRTFLELTAQFPQSLRLSTVEETGMSVRIWYTQIDSFGEDRMDIMQCYFREDPNTGMALDKVTISRRDYDPEKVKAFNRSLPVVLASQPDLTYPFPLPDSLEDLRLETDRFRKPILGPSPNE